MSLSTDIKDYYFKHLNELSDDKRFHFASRLGTWSNDAQALNVLQEFRNIFVQESGSEDAFQEYALRTIASPPTAVINAASQRQELFTQYPDLRGLDFILFRVRHLLTIYNVDTRDFVKKFIGIKKLNELGSNISRDHRAIRILSTYAVNFLYLNDILFGEKTLEPSAYLDIAQGYDLDNNTDLQLYIYLYTHCIIGASNFYSRALNSTDLGIYTKMLVELELTITKMYTQINLDNKLEFLVCCRICNYKTELQDKIYDECQNSVSSKGTFLVDRHNDNKQSEKVSFNDSEHRNVLFIMASSPYQN